MSRKGGRHGRTQASILSAAAVIVVENSLYSPVFVPHLMTKLGGWVTAEPPSQLFPGVPNQPK